MYDSDIHFLSISADPGVDNVRDHCYFGDDTEVAEDDAADYAETISDEEIFDDEDGLPDEDVFDDEDNADD